MRSNEIARFRKDAMTWAPVPRRTRDRSSSKVTSRIQWRWFSIDQWPRLKQSTRSELATAGLRLVMPYTVSERNKRIFIGDPNCDTPAARLGNLPHDEPRLFYLS